MRLRLNGDGYCLTPLPTSNFPKMPKPTIGCSSLISRWRISLRPQRKLTSKTDGLQAAHPLPRIYSLRANEALALRIGDLDFTRMRISVTKTITADRQGREIEGKPKSGRNRIVPSQVS